jgi:hypothetical protein
MPNDNQLPFDLPAVAGRKLTVDFDGGRLSSDGGLLLLREADRTLGVCDRVAKAMRDRRDPARVEHSNVDLVRMRAFAIACGYEDASDVQHLRHDPLMKVAIGRAPDSGAALASQPTISRLENAPSRQAVARMSFALVDQFCASFPRPPKAITLDVDDTVDEVHGGQQLGLWNAHYDCRCFLPIQVWHVESGKPVAILLREGKTPSGAEVAMLAQHLIARIRRAWPNTRITLRGDGHYGRKELMDWCEAAGVDYLLGFGGNAVLDTLSRPAADALCVRRAETGAEKLRVCKSFRYAAKGWKGKRRVIARIEASAQGLDIRYVVTSLDDGPRYLYDIVYCARGQAENLIKQLKCQLAADRTSCSSPLANQVRLVLHTAAYWLLHAVRAAVPSENALAKAELGTLRLKLVKIAARVVEGARRILVHLPSSSPEEPLFRHLAGTLVKGAP